MYLAHILAFDRQQACFRSFCLPELDPGYNMQLGGRNVSSYVYGLAFSLKGMLNNLTPFIFFFLNPTVLIPLNLLIDLMQNSK